MTMEQPAWLDEAWRENGVREVPGAASNPRILQFFAEVGHPDVARDEVAWCAAFLGACLERAGYASTRSLLARSYLNWGLPIEALRIGAIAVLSRGDDPGQGHVGFVVGVNARSVMLLGGNQTDAVNVQSFDIGRLLGLRWPTARAALPAGNGVFDAALAHVLEMEGHWSNDPHDPGGPTNRGITLAVYAAAKGVALTDANRAQLIDELKQIDPALVRKIYAERYWDLSLAARLPAQLAVMHFDAAVNHGVGNAARMMQEALGVVVDGEIGPQTLAAVRSQAVGEVVARYGDIRRARYRSLHHFWRFGRGWLRRVDRTTAAAERIGRTQSSTLEQTSPGDRNMPTTDAGTGTNKWWAHSLTIWGAVITAASTVLPVIGPLFGLDITSELVREMGEGVIEVVQAVGGLFGIVLTIYGRSRATTNLERRKVTFQL